MQNAATPRERCRTAVVKAQTACEQVSAMSGKPFSPPEESPVIAVIDAKTMRKIEKLAARYGIDPEDVLRELIKLDFETPPEGATLH